MANRIGKSKCYNNLSFKHFFVISHSNSLYFFRILGSMSTFLLFYSLFTVFCQMAKKISSKGSSSKPSHFGIVYFFFFLFIIFRRIWNILIWFTTAHKLKKLLGIFTDEWLIQISILLIDTFTYIFLLFILRAIGFAFTFV